MKKGTKILIGTGILAVVGIGAVLLLRKSGGGGTGTGSAPFADGTFVRDPGTGAIYIIEGGKKRHILSTQKWLTVYNGAQYTNEELNKDPAILAQIPTGASISGLGNVQSLIY